MYCYPCPGELGWQLFNWQPHVRYHLSHDTFDQIIAHVRRGYEFLFNFASDIRPFDYHPHDVECNAFYLNRSQAYQTYHEHLQQCDIEVDQLRRADHDVHVVRLPASRYRMHVFGQRMFSDLGKQLRPEAQETWNNFLGTGRFATVHVRRLRRAIEKNTRPRDYDIVQRGLEEHGFKVVIVGCDDAIDEFPVSGIDLRNQTNLEDLTAIFLRSEVVVGSSSGPMHLASLAKVPHIVWGGGRADIGPRYLRDWNPFHTPVQYLGTSFDLSSEADFTAALRKLLSKQGSAV